MSPTPSPPEPLLDGRYRLGALVGEGGMARVYRAEDVLLGRTVAVKVLRPGVEGSASPERAQAEVAALAALSHPALVMLLDASLEPGKPEYLVMEFVDGQTLAGALTAGPLSATEVAALAAELAEALHVVHGAGVVHRDLKPANILVTPSPLPHRLFRAKLADFGIAYLLDSARITTPGTVIGTASYLAPEQVRGAAPAPPADIYALGLVLLEALTGTRAFPAASAAEAALARLGAPPLIPADVGPGWRALLERMTDLDPARRPAALEVAIAAADLTGRTPFETATAVLPAAPGPGDEPTADLAPAHPAGPTSPTRRRRSPVLWATVAACAALALGLGTWAAVSAGIAEPAPAATVPATNDPGQSPTPPTTTSDPGVDPTLEQPADPAPPADEKAQRDAEKAQREAEREAEKARKEAEKEAEKAREEAEDDRDG